MRGLARRVRAAAAATALLAASLAAGAAAAELRRLESVGAVPLRADASAETPPRDAALRRALRDAVHRTALEMLPDVDPLEADEILDEALGADPLAYTPRFRIVEDRGERPALFVQDPEVESEYVVFVEAFVDRERVRSRLAAQGLLLAPSGEAHERHVRVVVEDLPSYAAYRELRRVLLDGVGARSVLPLEMERGRAVLAVEANLAPMALLEELLRAAPPELQITTLASAEGSITLRVALTAPPAGAAAAPSGRPD